MGANSFDELIGSQAFVCHRFVVSSLDLKIVSIKQNPIINVVVSGLFYTNAASLVVDSFEEIVDVVMQCSYLVQPFFCSRGAEFIVVINLHSVGIEAIEIAI